MLSEFSGNILWTSRVQINICTLRKALPTTPIDWYFLRALCLWLQILLKRMAGDLWSGVYDPLSLFGSLDSLFPSDPYRPFSRNPPAIPIDWKETPEAHILQAELPGLKKENVKLQVEDGVLEIVGKQEKEEAGDDKDVTWHNLERLVHQYGDTRVRQVRLPPDANVDKVKATMENGVLMVCLPKKEAGKANVKTVDIEVVNKEGLGKKIVKSLKGIIAPAKGK